jgi:hypothetical protein
MIRIASKRLSSLAKWELGTLFFLVLLCLALAVAGHGRKQRDAYKDFLRRAKMIEQAVLAFAKDHQGHFPPDGWFTNRPPGLDNSYIYWDPNWNIDYDVVPNGKGGFAVGLEYYGSSDSKRYYGLCRIPRVREKYGKGQPIPRQVNRIWLIRENAKIVKSPPKPKEG